METTSSTQEQKRKLSPIEDKQADISVIEALKKSLADEYILQLKTQNCHWNVEGPLFYSLHVLFEKQYKTIFESIDALAENLRALKEKAPGTLRELRELASIQDAPHSKMSAEQMIEALHTDHTHLAMALKARREIAESAEEISSVVIYEDLIKFHEKAAWMIRSHKENNS
jgi:starvation-inducible DNA-binding protein